MNMRAILKKSVKLLVVIYALCGTGIVEAETVQLFNQTAIYFTSSDDRREVQRTVSFPAGNRTFSRIVLNLRLSCPNGRCDWWDRKGALYILDEREGKVEFFRFMTPYRVGASWQEDVTDLRPLFTGNKKVVVAIDTYVGPGHPNGDGWMVDASLEFVDGTPAQPVVDVVPVFSAQHIVYGDPTRPAGLMRTVAKNPLATKARLRLYITGHGQGNTENCAEFCPKTHTINFGTAAANLTVWRDNCSQTRTDGPQMGTWTYSRAGWCPGDKVNPLLVDIPSEFYASENAAIRWTPQSYENYLRTNYNDGGHTEPYYQVSGLLILYR
jgi:hypothetical protein